MKKTGMKRVVISKSGKRKKREKRELEPEQESLDIWDIWTADVQEQLHKIADSLRGISVGLQGYLLERLPNHFEEIGEKLDRILEATNKLRLGLIVQDGRVNSLTEQVERMTHPPYIEEKETNKLPVPTSTVLEELEETL